ncbi:hypothetical protein BDV29DRAFT_162890 [Aspergillus leporis]|uniref:Uncharacterized protein n=1 Tax=Aspergillus leporis TaxID=41062 RepID=A0A5N5WJT1_9EURO|nr:hypothetical protein BDV29DRAFT_162890 [Aspergillus leporis]
MPCSVAIYNSHGLKQQSIRVADRSSSVAQLTWWEMRSTSRVNPVHPPRSSPGSISLALKYFGDKPLPQPPPEKVHEHFGDKPLPPPPKLAPAPLNVRSHHRRSWRLPTTYAVYNRRDRHGAWRRCAAVLLLLWAPTPAHSQEGSRRCLALADVLAYAPILDGDELRPMAAERVLAHVPDLEALRSWSRVLEAAFGRSGLPFARSALRRVSPVFWELREIGMESQDVACKPSYLRLLAVEMAVVARLRCHLLRLDRGLAGPDPRVGADDVDKALARIWIFCRTFRAHPHGINDTDGQQRWLAGESRSPRAGPDTPLPDGLPQDLLDQPFGIGNAGGLQRHELVLLLRTWDLLEQKLWELLGMHSLGKTLSSVNDESAASRLSLGLSEVDDLLTSGRDPWLETPLGDPNYRWGTVFRTACQSRLRLLFQRE